eukprot:GHVN01094961.1.p1 GENE.GHVN01094961.1~~GHVN01094961.1.p1  ORF type:complete len:212 (-),score=32.44 GHVN01094961.1:457-1092(-)
MCDFTRVMWLNQLSVIDSLRRWLTWSHLLTDQTDDQTHITHLTLTISPYTYAEIVLLSRPDSLTHLCVLYTASPFTCTPLHPNSLHTYNSTPQFPSHLHPYTPIPFTPTTLHPNFLHTFTSTPHLPSPLHLYTPSPFTPTPLHPISLQPYSSTLHPPSALHLYTPSPFIPSPLQPISLQPYTSTLHLPPLLHLYTASSFTPSILVQVRHSS